MSWQEGLLRTGSWEGPGLFAFAEEDIISVFIGALLIAQKGQTIGLLQMAESKRPLLEKQGLGVGWSPGSLREAENQDRCPCSDTGPPQQLSSALFCLLGPQAELGSNRVLSAQGLQMKARVNQMEYSALEQWEGVRGWASSVGGHILRAQTPSLGEPAALSLGVVTRKGLCVVPVED